MFKLLASNCRGIKSLVLNKSAVNSASIHLSASRLGGGDKEFLVR
jgi:hypothetical protein